jgi:hypothetical protein
MHVLHDDGSAPTAAWQDGVSAPPEHAVASVSRLALVHTFCSDGVCGRDVPGGQKPYCAGHVVCWLLHVRGVTRLSQNEPVKRQLEHAAPPCPHELLSMPSSSHEPSGLQQPAQLPGPQAVVHVWFWHFWPDAEQSEQAPPPDLPHAVSESPGTHLSPWQHPFGHVAGPHGCASHLPALHVWPRFTQFKQSAPPVPHAVAWFPNAQMSPTQQPVGQLEALHAPVTTHCPAVLHISLEPHVLQASPLLPHARFVWFVTHVLPAQQPGQFCGPQSPVCMQIPPLGPPAGMHVSVELQGAQACPFAPHAKVLVPSTHWPDASQQPAQLPGPQVVVPWHTPPPIGTGRHWSVDAQVAH